MRSAAEIRFRLEQELYNFRYFLKPPQLRGGEAARPVALLPDPEAVVRQLRGTRYAEEVERIAELILLHRFPLLGTVVETGPEIRWRRDYLSGVETGTEYFRRIPYLDVSAAGDHKIVWELNRHQHLVLLAQAGRLTGREEFRVELFAQLDSWIAQNPFQRGMNWTSALEVAFRALSWIWIDHLAGEHMPAELRGRFLTSLYQHGLHLERNLSVYFSPNTHLLGEAVALHAVGVFYPGFRGARRWARTGGRIVREEMGRQVREDGSHFEQSTYYHVYALDMFLFHAVLAGADGEYERKLGAMAGYLDALLGYARAIPVMGDDDGGRFFHPFGERDEFGRGTLAMASALLSQSWQFAREDGDAIAAWWSGKRPLGAVPARAASRLFPDAGLAVMAHDDIRIYVDAGPMGPRRAGHSHADALSVVVRKGAREILIDPGTYTYVSDPEWRNRFRGTAAHNTVRVDGLDQANPSGPFGWTDKPETAIESWSQEAGRDVLTGWCRYRGVTHRRTVEFDKTEGLLRIADEVRGPEGAHHVEQFWHGDTRGLGLVAPLGWEREESEGGEWGWRSRALGAKEVAPFLRIHRAAELPVTLRQILALNAD